MIEMPVENARPERTDTCGAIDLPSTELAAARLQLTRSAVLARSLTGVSSLRATVAWLEERSHGNPRLRPSVRAGRSGLATLTGVDGGAALRDADAVLTAADPLDEFDLYWHALFTFSVAAVPAHACSAALATRRRVLGQVSEWDLIELDALRARALRRMGDLRSTIILLGEMLPKAIILRSRPVALRIVWSLAEATRSAGTARVDKRLDLSRRGHRAQVTPDGLMARGAAQGAVEQFGSALRTYLDCGEMLADAGVDSPELIRWRPAAVQTLLRLGRSAEAERLAEENLERAQLFGTNGAIGFAQYVVALTRPRYEREPLLVEAVSRLQAAGQLLDEASAHYELGKVLLAVGATFAADHHLLRSIQLADDCGARPLAEQARAVAGPAVSLGALRGLTAQERKVARLVATGLSNPEIASQLFLARRTVEFHLSGVYRKLDLTGRHDLIQLLSEGA